MPDSVTRLCVTADLIPNQRADDEGNQAKRQKRRKHRHDRREREQRRARDQAGVVEGADVARLKALSASR